MAQPYHLRPAASSSASATMPSTSHRDVRSLKNSPPHEGKIPRTVTPVPLRDINLAQNRESQPRHYPAPPTGHDLMAMFSAPPDCAELQGGPTSGFFERQERAYFAQSGSEILSIQMQMDFQDPSLRRSKVPFRPPPLKGPGSVPQPPPTSQTPLYYPHPGARGQPKPPPPTEVTYHIPARHQHPPGSHPSSAHPSNSSPSLQDAPMSSSDDGGDEDDRRRPMAPNGRRRAGKHTRRVIVR